MLSKLCEEPLRQALGLPDAPEPTPPLLEIQAYDERCLPGQPDQWAEPGKPFAGALTLESPTDADDAVLSWIAEGTAPIYFGLGSTPISPPAEIVEMMIAACAQLNARPVGLLGTQRLSEYDHFDHVKIVSAVNHAAIFPGMPGDRPPRRRRDHRRGHARRRPFADPVALARPAGVGGGDRAAQNRYSAALLRCDSGLAGTT